MKFMPEHGLYWFRTRRDGAREQYRVAVAGEDGRALLTGIPPGIYKLFAWEELEPNAYFNSTFLQAYESLGVPLTIATGENRPLSVRLIPKD
jgi:hypothetical protein